MQQLNKTYKMSSKMKNALLAIAVIAMMARCCGKSCKPMTSTAADSTAVANDTASVANDSLVYEGIVPAADCAGIRYCIALDARKEAFSMKEDYMESEAKVKDSFNEKGTVEPYSKNGKKGLKLSNGKNDGSELYFVSVGDSILRMVNDELEEATSANSYDLKLRK